VSRAMHIPQTTAVHAHTLQTHRSARNAAQHSKQPGDTPSQSDARVTPPQRAVMHSQCTCVVASHRGVCLFVTAGPLWPATRHSQNSKRAPRQPHQRAWCGWLLHAQHTESATDRFEAGKQLLALRSSAHGSLHKLVHVAVLPLQFHLNCAALSILHVGGVVCRRETRARARGVRAIPVCPAAATLCSRRPDHHTHAHTHQPAHSPGGQTCP
jgi:hypothetical protein